MDLKIFNKVIFQFPFFSISNFEAPSHVLINMLSSEEKTDYILHQFITHTPSGRHWHNNTGCFTYSYRTLPHTVSFLMDLVLTIPWQRLSIISHNLKYQNNQFQYLLLILNFSYTILSCKEIFKKRIDTFSFIFSLFTTIQQKNSSGQVYFYFHTLTQI